VLDAIDELVRVQLASRGLTGPTAKANLAEHCSALSVYDLAESQLRAQIGHEVDECDLTAMSEVCERLIEAGGR
jgi:hypothetical protein